MAQTKKKQNNLTYWFVIGLIGQLLVAPNTTILKVVLNSVDPTTFNTLRAAVCAIVAAPFVIWYWKRLNRQNAVYAIAAGICTAISFTLTTYAIQASQASYAVILSLLGPVVLIVLSQYFFHEKVRLQAAAGVTLAALGAFAAVALPFLIGGHTSLTVYPFATGLLVLANIFLPLTTILLRKANEAGLPLASTQGVSATIVMIISFGASFAIHGAAPDLKTVPPEAWFGIAYSAVFVLLIARILTTSSFERVGSAVTSGFNYLGILIALVIPLVFLHEKLSTAMIIGGMIILIGVYLTERHKSKHPHHWHFLPHIH